VLTGEVGDSVKKQEERRGAGVLLQQVLGFWN
jgi:hypothetical protein